MSVSQEAEEFAERIRDRMRKHYDLEDHELVVRPKLVLDLAELVVKLAHQVESIADELDDFTS